MEPVVRWVNIDSDYNFVMTSIPAHATVL